MYLFCYTVVVGEGTTNLVLCKSKKNADQQMESLAAELRKNIDPDDDPDGPDSDEDDRGVSYSYRWSTKLNIEVKEGVDRYKVIARDGNYRLFIDQGQDDDEDAILVADLTPGEVYCIFEEDHKYYDRDCWP